jgi:nitrate/TMAO reductase-like tetraheme cytochrome c subunit
MEPRIPKLKEFPCSECHRDKGPVKNPKAPAKYHAFTHKHFKGDNKCSICHLGPSFDQLKMKEGSPRSFNQIPDVCGQCHGLASRDFKKGIHGQLSGSWMKRTLMFNCVDCHDAHDPKFPQMKADPLPNLQGGKR